MVGFSSDDKASWWSWCIPHSYCFSHADDHQASPLLCALIPTIVLILVEHALNNVWLFSGRRYMCQPGDSQEASAGLSNRGCVIQGIGYVDDGSAKKLNQRWDGPEISHSSFTPTAGSIAGLGVVAEFRSQGVTIRTWSCCGASAGNREGGRDIPKPLSFLLVLYLIFCQCLLLVTPIHEPEGNGTWEM